jgi:F-type H+-transporting ATPase subunit a
VSKLLRNPKLVTALVVVGIIFLLSLAGGALGNEFGGGFLGSPLAHIQLPAESITAKPVIAGFHITNTMIATWAAIVLLVVVSYFATRRLSDVPRGLQNVVEVIIEGFLGLAESVAGPEKGRRFLPLVLTIFIFVVVSNWLGILPGFGTIGRVETVEEVVHHAEEKAEDEGGHADLSKIKVQVFEGDGPVAYLPFGSIENEITAEEYEEHGVEEGKQAGVLVPFLRSANTDVNTTLAIALVAMFMVHVWGFTSLGIFGHIGKFINLKAGPIGLFVGVLEAISEVARVISFTFRLFGNIFAGEVLLIAIAFLLPLIGIIPFLGLELFVGLIQAFIFSMLTLVFATMATVSHAEDEH